MLASDLARVVWVLVLVPSAVAVAVWDPQEHQLPHVAERSSLSQSSSLVTGALTVSLTGLDFQTPPGVRFVLCVLCGLPTRICKAGEVSLP